MTQNGWGQNWQAQNQQIQQNQNWQGEITLPHDLRGPFIREFTPAGPYKHRGSQVASVLFYRNGGFSVATVRGTQHVNKPMLGRPSSVCWIARGQHQVSFSLELPTLGDRAHFTAGADVNWEVRDFHLAAEKRVVDVERMLRPPLQARLREITRRHKLDSAQLADEAIQYELANGGWDQFGADLGLSTQVFIRIDLGQAAAQYHAQMVAVQQGSEVQRAIDAAATARVEANMETARTLISAGEAEQYATLIAQDPSRAPEILGALQHQAREQRQGALDYLTKLINQGVVQRHQIDDQVQMLIDYSRSVAGGAFEHGLPQAPTALPIPPMPSVPPVPPSAVLSAPDGVKDAVEAADAFPDSPGGRE